MKAAPKKQTKKKIARKVPLRSEDVLVTQKMLSETKSELKREITSTRLELKDEITAVRSELKQEIESVRTDVHSLRQEMNVRFLKIDSKLEAVIATVHRTNALVEEQNSRRP
jgi:hypothetical protein